MCQVHPKKYYYYCTRTPRGHKEVLLVLIQYSALNPGKPEPREKGQRTKGLGFEKPDTALKTIFPFFFLLKTVFANTASQHFFRNIIVTPL
jgi:hypothetical protein